MKYTQRYGVCRIALLALILITVAGCQRLMNQDAAIQKAIRQHLTERSDLAMDKMVMEMQKVTVDGDKAQAEVVFRVASGGGAPESRMGYHYDLHREGGAWKVDSGRPAGAETTHPQMGEGGQGMPSGGGVSGAPMRGDGSGPSDSMALPEGHPPVGGVSPGANPHGDTPPPSSQK
jgi:hypothetical protein